MDPATIVGIGGQLLGGLFGNRRAKKAAAQERAWALEDQAQQFVRLRSAAESAGFNPLTVLGAAPGSGMVNPTPVSSNNYMGSAIADSALMLADNLAKTKAAAMGRQVQMLARQNRRISSQLTQATLRPKVGGVYDGARTFGTGAANAGIANDAVDVPRVSGRHVPVGLHVGPVSVSEYNASNAEDFEKRYGDVGSSVIGLGIMSADAGATFAKYLDRFWAVRETQRRDRQVNPFKYYTPSMRGGFDALTGSTYPAARLDWR